MVNHEIIGDDMQAVILTLGGGDAVRAEAGAMMFMTDAVEMDAKMEGGVLGGLKRKFLAGESFFITHFRASAAGKVAFAGPYPGKIIPLDITPGQQILCQKDSFLCAVGEIDISIAFTRRIGAGFFGGEGFILEKLTGPGHVFIHGGGDFIEFQLGPAETLRVDTGCVVGFEESVSYDIQLAGGIKTAIFGGEGLFLTTLTGPGKVIVQSMTLEKLRRELTPSGTGGDERSPLESLGGFFKSED